MGKAQVCGNYWTLSSPADNMYPANPLLSADDYLSNIFAVCPEWDDATDIVRCNIPVGYNAVVGIGQTDDCADGTTLIPSAVELQLVGPICDLTQDDPKVSCTFCGTNRDWLQLSSCVQVEDYPCFEGADSSSSADKKSKGQKSEKSEKGKKSKKGGKDRRLGSLRGVR